MSRKRPWLVAGCLLVLPVALNGQVRDVDREGDAPEPQAAVAPEKEAFATRVDGGAVEIDGRLDEQAWALATPISDFVQREPTEGTAPTQRTEVRFLYDDN